MNRVPDSGPPLTRSSCRVGGRSAIAVLAGICSVVGCGSDEQRTQVLVLGDSITNLTTEELFDRADDDRQLTVRARDGATTAEMAAVARDEDPSAYEQVIVNLGTNDLMAQTPAGETEDVFEELVALFDGARCVHLTTINEHIVNFDIPDLSQRVGELNNRFRAMVEDHSNVHLIDWNAELASHREQGEPDGELLADMVHPTDAGQEALRHLYLQALDSCE